MSTLKKAKVKPEHIDWDRVADDLAKTETDRARLESIVSNMRAFIFETDEDRAFSRPDLLSFEEKLDECKNREAKLRNLLNENLRK